MFYWSKNNVHFMHGDVIARLKDLPTGSVHCVVTSPPYWGLRNYQSDGQLGLEKTPAEYVKKMVAVFVEIWRVLRDDGTCWLNLGDSYGHGTSADRQQSKNPGVGANTPESQNSVGSNGGFVKQLIGIPWRVAFALQEAGWYLRQDIIWAKPGPMPESVTDRCTKAHEYVFLLTKKESYYYDRVAIFESCAEASKKRYEYAFGGKKNKELLTTDNQTAVVGNREFSGFRNKRSVWNISSVSYKGAHFATFPPKLVEPIILAGTSACGCCKTCGAPWERIIERNRRATRPGTDTKVTGDSTVDGNRDLERHVTEIKTLGWKQTCTCICFDVEPCTVLDSFSGSGTTGMVANAHSREFVGIDLSEDYLNLAIKRVERFWNPADKSKKFSPVECVDTILAEGETE